MKQAVVITVTVKILMKHVHMYIENTYPHSYVNEDE